MKQKAKQQKRRLIPGQTGNRKRVSGKTGLPPGTLVHIGEIFQEETTVYLSTFTPDEYHRRKTSPVEIPEQLKTGGVCWFEVYGLHQVDVISDLGQALEISPMILEDVLNTGHRPKIDIRDKHIFMTLKHFHLTESREITMEQVSLVLGRGYLVSFQETTSPLFDEIRKRLQTGSGKIRQRSSDYLFYALTDVVVDHLYLITEHISDRLDDLEEAVFRNPSESLIDHNQLIRKDISAVRKALIPLRDDIARLIKEEPSLVMETTQKYYYDILDHVDQILDMMDTCREITNEIRERYLSNLSYRMNQVMKLLAIITTIFIPLSFIAGIYGMNFANMPELQWEYGYYGVLALMALLMVSMIIYFSRKKWI